MRIGLGSVQDEGRQISSHSNINNPLWSIVIGDYSLKCGRINACHPRDHITRLICKGIISRKDQLVCFSDSIKKCFLKKSKSNQLVS